MWRFCWCWRSDKNTHWLFIRFLDYIFAIVLYHLMEEQGINKTFFGTIIKFPSPVGSGTGEEEGDDGGAVVLLGLRCVWVVIELV